ncbi:hypothetical protein [Mycoplana ramosa]|uniref:DUF222 domain-containing protein n=1 Tax=Mycoplana ramosa TaxID=40837 RepID=A0ABW3YWI5_MYCRA
MAALQQIKPGSDVSALPSMIAAASARLARAKEPAEILIAREAAGVVFDAARRAARLARATKSHHEIVDLARRAQIDALEIEAMADARLADEVDQAQQDGGFCRGRPSGDSRTLADFGLSRKQVFVARSMRALISKHPKALRAALEDLLQSGAEPTRAYLRSALKGLSPRSNRNAARGDQPFRLLSGRDVRELSFVEIAQLRRRAEVETAFLALIEGYAANVEPGERIGAVIADDRLAAMLESVSRCDGESV